MIQKYGEYLKLKHQQEKKMVRSQYVQDSLIKMNSIPASLKYKSIYYSFNKYISYKKVQIRFLDSLGVMNLISNNLNSNSISQWTDSKFNYNSIKHYIETEYKNHFIQKYSGYVQNLILSYKESQIWNQIIESFLLSMHCISSQPIYINTPSKLTILLYYYPIKKNSRYRKSRYRFTSRLINRSIKKNTNSIYDMLSPLFWMKNNQNLTLSQKYEMLYNLMLKEPYLNLTLKRSLEKTVHKFKLKFQKLAFILSRHIRKEVELEFIELHYPFLNSDILSKLITYNSHKNTFARIQKKLFDKAGFRDRTLFLESFKKKLLKKGLRFQITGMKIRLAGRLVREKTKPRKTVQLKQFGTFTPSTQSWVNTSSTTFKNKKGAFTFKFWFTQQYIK